MLVSVAFRIHCILHFLHLLKSDGIVSCLKSHMQVTRPFHIHVGTASSLQPLQQIRGGNDEEEFGSSAPNDAHAEDLDSGIPALNENEVFFVPLLRSRLM